MLHGFVSVRRISAEVASEDASRNVIPENENRIEHPRLRQCPRTQIMHLIVKSLVTTHNAGHGLRKSSFVSIITVSMAM
jgi:hypothetical protein